MTVTETKKSAKTYSSPHDSAKSEITTSKVETPPRSAAAQLISQGLVIQGQKKAAKYASVSEKTLQRWDKDAEIQNPPVIHYLIENRKYYYYKNFLDELKGKEGTGTNKNKIREQKAKAGKAEKQDTLLDIQIKEKQKELISREEVERKTIAQITAVKRAHQGFSRTIMPLIKPFLRNPDDTPAIEAIIDNELRQIHERFAKGLRD